MLPYIDLHTHHPVAGQNVIPVYNHLLPGPLHHTADLFSAGLHPWHADRVTPAVLRQLLDDYAKNEKMVALGETGLDKACEISLAVQREIFEIHLDKAAEYRMPVLIHVVRAWQEILEAASGYNVPKIVHGYNGSPELTDQLVSHGYYFSIGKSILNPGSKIRSSISRIPVSSLFCETDESDVSIAEIYAAVATSLSMEAEELTKQVQANFAGIILQVKG